MVVTTDAMPEGEEMGRELGNFMRLIDGHADGKRDAESFARNEWSGGGREFRMLLDRCEFTGTSFGLAGAKETRPAD